jgi:hypothetical protein
VKKLGIGGLSVRGITGVLTQLAGEFMQSHIDGCNLVVHCHEE